MKHAHSVPRLSGKVMVFGVVSLLAVPVVPALLFTEPLGELGDDGLPGDSYSPHARIKILSDAEFCVPDGVVGWLDTGVVNCAIADGSRGNPYRISGWSIDNQQGTGLEGIGIRVWNVSKSFVVGNNYLFNGSRFQTNSSSAISLRVISDDQIVPSWLATGGQNVIVERNLVDGFRTGLSFDLDVGGRETTTAGQTYRFVRNNTFVSNEQSLFLLTPVTVEHNNIWNSSVVAVWQSHFTSNFVLRANDIRNTPLGFSLNPCPFVDMRPVVEFNNFANTSDWAVRQRGCTDVVLASNNYWGDPSGPRYRRFQDSTLEPLIFDPLGVPDFFVGSGGNVTYGVQFAPWLEAPNPFAGPMPEP